MLNTNLDIKIVLYKVNVEEIENSFIQKLVIKKVYKKFYVLSPETFSELCTLNNSERCLEEIINNEYTTLRFVYGNQNVFLTFKLILD